MLILSMVPACATTGPPPISTAEPAPAPPQSGNAVDAAVVHSVRGYLHTFNLNEKDLKVGLSIPFALSAYLEEASAIGNFCSVGTARATGRTGPQGHQVYEVIWVDVASGMAGVSISHKKLVEIPPDPETAAVPTVGAPPPSPAPSAR
jgi:hypothetical protein